MRSNHPDAGRPGATARSLALACLVTVAALLAPLSAVSADELPVDAPPIVPAEAETAPSELVDSGECVGDDCDGGEWMVARGESNENSYWGMSPGHNCTNYVAWRLIQDGVERPSTSPGNAANWATRARADGYIVNNVPVAGAVAQWDGLAGGNGPEGHVAYIERVNEDGTILVSEDYWLGGTQSGSLTYRIADMATVSNVIHYIDSTSWLRRADAGGGSWRVNGMGLNPNAEAIAAMKLAADGSVRIFLKEAGALRVVTESDSGWQIMDTGVPITGTTISAVDMHRSWPYLMASDKGELVMHVRTSPGWQRMQTGVAVTEEFDAVDLGALLPTVYVSDSGALYEVWNDLTGWHKLPTGTDVQGAISATVSAAGWPEVFSVEEGLLYRSWADELGWHKESTGVAASGAFSAARVGDAIHVMVQQDGDLLQITQDATGTWSARVTGITAGRVLTTLDSDADSPVIVQIGVSGSAEPVVTGE